MPTKLTTRIQSWDKSGKELLDEYLDSLVPELVAWVILNDATEWPDIQEDLNIVDELPSFRKTRKTPALERLVNASASPDWKGFGLKVTWLIMDRWRDPKDVSKSAVI